MSARSAHDVGGLASLDPLDLTEHQYAFWEQQTHVLVVTLVRTGLFTLDEFRRAIESLPEYESMSYYQRWAAGAAAICAERGIISRTDLDERLGPTLSDNTPKFSGGDIVRVKPESSIVRWRKPHLRTPGYIFGIAGVVERHCLGLFEYPEGTAFREVVPPQPLYRVRFLQKDVWEGYLGGPQDTIDVEIFQPWLEKATTQQLEEQAQKRQKVEQQVHAGSHGDHEHEGHEHEGHGHQHEERAVVEQRAVDSEGDSAQERRVAEALLDLLVDKGVLTREQLRKDVEEMDAKGMKGYGPKLVARAWADPEFKVRLLSNAAAACSELGISASNYPPPQGKDHQEQPTSGPPVLKGTVLTAVENTAYVHNVVVCTLCSCYPLSILGMAPQWYKSRSYRARMVREPRSVLAEFGTLLPPEKAIRVHDSTAELRYIVIPERPAGTEGWDEERLATLVTRDSMIGVTPAITAEK